MNVTDFENQHRIDVMTSTALINKAPKQFNWNAFYKTFQRQTISPRELAIHVWRGYSFTPVWKDNRREGDYVTAYHLAFDFDAGDETSSLPYLMQPGSFAWMFASFGYTTPSHTAEAPRARVVFALEYPIDNPQEYREVYQAVAWMISGDGSYTDPACKDPLRLYYGSKGCEVSPNWSVLSKATIDCVLAQYREAHPAVEQKATLRRIETNPSEKVKDIRRRRIVEAVSNAPKGERHITLLRRAREAGGYVASGAFNEADIAADLIAAAGDFGDGETGRKEAERVVRDGLRYGKAAPLQFETVYPVGEILP
jgi:hypothetical protein